MTPELKRSIDIAKLVLAFARVNRATFHEDGERPETDTDHTVMLGVLACDLAVAMGLHSYATFLGKGLNVGRIAEFALVHDLVEAMPGVGDVQTLRIDEAGRKAKAEREAKALEELYVRFGPESWLARTIKAYEEQREPEARYIRVLDKVTPKLTHYLNACVAAKAILGSNPGAFEQSHQEQAERLLREYPDVAASVHALLAESMFEAQRSWSEGPERQGGIF